MQVEEFLEQSAVRLPRKVALVCGSHRLTYAEIEGRANRLAYDLISAGIRRGDRVVIHMENSVQAVLAIFAVLKADAVFVIVNPSTRPAKLAYLLDNCRAAGLVTDAHRANAFSDHWGEAPHLRAIWVTGSEAIRSAPSCTRSLDEAIAQPGCAVAPHRRGIDMDLGALVYTSGSTGKPKGVMLTHLNMVSAANSITAYLENTPDDIILNVLPLSFDYGLYQVLMAFKVGGTVVLERSFTFARTILETMAKEKVTGFPIVPTIAAILLQTDLTPFPLPDLRYITNTAAALPTEHIRRLRKCFSHVKIFSMYGLTECKRVSYLPPEQIGVRAGSIGRGMPNEEVYLVDESGRRLPPGSAGELVVRGSNVMPGYWELPEETAAMLRPGPYPWEKVLHTGDLFRMDAEGYLYFIGRKDDIIKCKAEKVSPREVEEAICEIPAVAEAAVVGIPDPVLGQAIKAVVVLREGYELTANEVLRHCARVLEDFMVPKFVEFRKEMPKTPSGKVAKRELEPVAVDTE